LDFCGIKAQEMMTNRQRFFALMKSCTTVPQTAEKRPVGYSFDMREIQEESRRRLFPLFSAGRGKKK